MSKILYVVRHAKADKELGYSSDFERVLEPRGRTDALNMGTYLSASCGVRPDLLISSPAFRAKETALLMAGKLGYSDNKIQYESSMYGASVAELADLIRGLEDHIHSVMIFGHNPEFTEFCEYFSNISLGTMATCGVCCIKFNTDRWDDIGRGEGRLLWYEYPKKINKE